MEENHRGNHCWEAQKIDYPVSVIARLYGIDVAVMPERELIRYKTMLDRDVDHQDIQEMGEHSNNGMGSSSTTSSATQLIEEVSQKITAN